MRHSNASTSFEYDPGLRGGSTVPARGSVGDPLTVVLANQHVLRANGLGKS